MHYAAGKCDKETKNGTARPWFAEGNHDGLVIRLPGRLGPYCPTPEETEKNP